MSRSYSYRSFRSEFLHQSGVAPGLAQAFGKLQPGVIVIALTAGLVVGCGTSVVRETKSTAGRPRSAQVTIFAAASLIDALNEATKRFQASTNAEFQTNFGSSGQLAQQIALGAPADVFFSASLEWIDYLEQRNQLAQHRAILENRLVVATRKGRTTLVRKPEDLLEDRVQRIAIADPEVAPAGIYAKKALVRLGLWEKLKEKLVTSSDVRQALAYVSTQATQVGIVYATDVAVEPNVEIACEFPSDVTGPICYGVALTESGARNPTAVRFFEFIINGGARTAFEKAGFVWLDSSLSAN